MSNNDKPKFTNSMWTKEEQEAVNKYVKSIKFIPKSKEEKK
jgi:hypothetical protein